MELVASTRLSKEGSRPQWVKRYDGHEPTNLSMAMKLMDGGIIMFLWMILINTSVVKDWDIL